MYEELLAFRQAAEAVGLSAEDIADVMYNNAARLITKAGGVLGACRAPAVSDARSPNRLRDG